jgi:formamidopyrimidine-DNA glycosylase
MPELPEVEVVRMGLAEHVVGRRIDRVTVHHPRSVRRHEPGPADFADRLAGAMVVGAERRGKYLWLPIEGGDAVLAHLGMSGQMLIAGPDVEEPRHLRIAFDLDDGNRLLFADQRIFGGMSISDVSVTQEGAELPAEIAHIARDPLDALFDPSDFRGRLRRRQTGVKRALLDQTLISGVGNIYADEALWRTPLHYARNTRHLRTREIDDLLHHVSAVMLEALAQGGTTFDTLYVNVNGESGYFERSLAVYGQEGLPCRRCGTAIRREPFMNRSSYRCPVCQPRPRHGRW